MEPVPVAIGCPQCNAEIAEAERSMKDKIAHIARAEYSRYRNPLPDVLLDGEPLRIRGIVAVTQGPEGAVLANHQDPDIPFPNKAHACPQHHAIVRALYRGNVEFEVPSPVPTP